jgi:hypothetical protein
MTVDELDRHYQEILLSFYKRPKLGLYYASLSIRYPHHLLRLARFGLGFLAAKIRSYAQGRHGLLVQPGASPH